MVTIPKWVVYDITYHNPVIQCYTWAQQKRPNLPIALSSCHGTDHDKSCIDQGILCPRAVVFIDIPGPKGCSSH